MFWYFICVLLVVVGIYCGYFVIKFHNPFRLDMIFGKKGCGKTTTLCMLALKYQRKGWTVYSTEALPGCRKFDVQNLGQYHFAKKSVILIDEVGMIWDNRDFKNFKTHVRDWFKYQRHAQCRVYLFSQTFDIDKKLRDLTDEMYMMVNVLGVLSYGKRIKKKICVVHPSGDGESRLADDLEISPFFTAPFGGRMFCWIPKYAKYIQSFDIWELPDMPYELVSYPDDMPKKLLPKKLRKNKQTKRRVPFGRRCCKVFWSLLRKRNGQRPA